MADYTAYFNGEWMPVSEVKIDPADRGFLVGDTVFEVLRTFNGKSFRLKEHVERLYRSLKYVRMDPGLSPEELIELTEEGIRRNEELREPVGDYQIWQWVTRGVGWRTREAGPSSVCIKMEPIPFSHYAPYYDGGLHGVIVRTRSLPVETLDPKAKTFSRMYFNMADLEASDVDPDAWPILTDADGNLTEGIGQNVLLVTDGVIRTAGDKGVLQGVSRGMVLDLAEQLNIPAVEEDLQPYDLYNADEAFYASTSLCVLPITKVDNRQIGDGKPGPIVKQLLAAWSEGVGLDIVDQMQRFAHQG